MSKNPPSTNQVLRIVFIGILLLVVAMLPYRWLFENEHALCLHYYLFGFQCPLCGMSRAVYLFAHFQFIAALKYNFVVIFFPVYFLLDITTLFWRRKGLFTAKKIVVISMAGSFLALYIFRIAVHAGLC